MPHSHHSHSGQFCRHAKDNLEDIVQEAIKQGFDVYGLSEHAPRCRVEDLYPEESDLHPSDLDSTFDSYLYTATVLKEKYKDQVSLLVGLETENITGLDLAKAKELLKDKRIDYVVGSVHHVHGIPIDFDRPTWLKAIQKSLSASRAVKPKVDIDSVDPSSSDFADALRPLLVAYLDAQYGMIQALKPEVIGHFDLCLLFTPEISLRGAGDEVWSRVERNVRFVIEYGGLFEANSAALRKGWKTSYPSEDVLDLVLSLGGRICLSDDSHGVAQVGLNYTRMRDYLLGKGVDIIWHLVVTSHAQEGDQQVGGRTRVAARPISMEKWHAAFVDDSDVDGRR